MSYLSRILLILPVLALAAPAAARSDCPWPYNDDVCAVQGSNPCSYHSNPNEYRCTNFGGYGDKLWLVSDPTRVWAWGTKRIGRTSYEFCCAWSHGGTMVPAVVDMGDGNNEVYLTYGSENYEDSSEIRTGDDNDIIWGSNYDDCDYPCDTIYPNDGVDVVKAWDGDDLIFCEPWDYTDEKNLQGGYGHDKIVGSGGDDEIDGSYGDDWIIAQAGDDTVHGGYDLDSIYGRSGGDELHSDHGDYYAREFHCGETGADSCYCPSSGTLCARYCDCGGDDWCNAYGQTNPENECPDDPLGEWAP